MGNKLCSNGKEAYNGSKSRLGEPDWNPKKDTHLLRLWAEVFRVQDNEFGWERVSDDVVPINITCLGDTANRVFQITAYSRNALRLFDARIIHPGTPLYQANECFVHWKDLVHNCEWGLNFTSPVDARRFQDCCASTHSGSGTQRLHAKSASSASLRNSFGSPSKIQYSRTDANSLAAAAAAVGPSAAHYSAGVTRRTASHPDGLPVSMMSGLDNLEAADATSCTCGSQHQHLHQHQHQHQHPADATPLSVPVSAPAVKRRAFADTRSRSEDDRSGRGGCDAMAADSAARQQQLLLLHHPAGSDRQHSRPRKETSVDDIVQDWTTAAQQTSQQQQQQQQQQQSLLMPIDSPVEIPVDCGTLDRLLNTFPEVSASPTPMSGVAAAGGQQDVARMGQTLRRINSNRQATGEWGGLDEAPEMAPPVGLENAATSSISLQSQTRDRSLRTQQQVDGWQTDSDAGSVTSLNSSLSTMQSDSQASASRQAGAIRKSGWLRVKNWLVHKKRRVELAPQRRWHEYWVCLKGTVLLFFKDCQQESLDKPQPKHSLIIEGCIAQPLPEHPKKENVFSLSTAFGDAYMLQASDKSDLDGWVASLHSACASQIARQHSKSDTVRLIRSEIAKLESGVEVDSKMKKVAELQLTQATDSRHRQTLQRDIQVWEETLERLLIELYRHRCYMASLMGQELPNPKNILSNVSKSSKLILSKLELFNLTAFHALVCARAPMTTAVMRFRDKEGRHQKGIGERQSSQGRHRNTPGIVAAEDSDGATEADCGAEEFPGETTLRRQTRQQSWREGAATPRAGVAGGFTRLHTASSCATLPRKDPQQRQRDRQNPQHHQPHQHQHQHQQVRVRSDIHIPRSNSSGVTDNTPTSSEISSSGRAAAAHSGGGAVAASAAAGFADDGVNSVVGIRLPTGQIHTTRVQEGMTVQEILDLICYQSGLESRNHYIRLRLSEHGIDIIPDNYTVFENQVCD